MIQHGLQASRIKFELFAAFVQLHAFAVVFDFRVHAVRALFEHVR